MSILRIQNDRIERRREEDEELSRAKAEIENLIKSELPGDVDLGVYYTGVYGFTASLGLSGFTIILKSGDVSASLDLGELSTDEIILSVSKLVEDIKRG